jgi:sugar (pentulose or hexulose) kinase
MLLGVDVGTTHCKAGLFGENGNTLSIATRPMHASRTSAGEYYYDPEALWEIVAGTLAEVTTGFDPNQIRAVGIASMAETGGLIDRRSGQPRSVFNPWFDTRTQSLADRLSHQVDPYERFIRTGLRLNFKCSVLKLLHLLEADPSLGSSLVWLSVADYVAYRLTGMMATDYSLAGRTCAFRIDRKEWDAEWLDSLGLSPDWFPPARRAVEPVGEVKSTLPGLGLVAGTPVAIAGHDHICAGYALGAVNPGQVFDSMGTAESMVGALADHPLGEREYRSGLAYGCHVVPERMYWLGGLSDAGGSLSWLRSILGSPPPTFEDLEALLDSAGEQPGEIAYFPYLTGCETPFMEPKARGAFVGLSAGHNQADLVKAVLEGTAYAVELIRRVAERSAGTRVERIMAAGGGTRSRHWMQIKADITGCRYEIPAMPEATLLGAALIAGIGAGVFGDEAQALSSLDRSSTQLFLPDPDRHALYRHIFEQKYLAFEESLRAFYRNQRMSLSIIGSLDWNPHATQPIHRSRRDRRFLRSLLHVPGTERFDPLFRSKRLQPLYVLSEK